MTTNTEDRALNLLLVDDDDIDVMTVRRAFAKARLTNPLYVASDGVEALRMLRDGSVPAARRLVLLDINMPRMNGIEFLREIRADEALRNTAVVVLTTSSADEDKMNAYEFNVAGYLIKPVTFSTFVEAMSTLDRYWTLVEMPS
ncbi:MAG TPA: response regulator [Rubrivivax sp.]|jgi:CheY-like chemotaxis protein|nr:response regulator [Rubrivivax sp.]